METRPQKYELSQNGKKYILSTQILGENIKLTCIETGISNPPIFEGEFSITQLRQLSTIFNTISSIIQALELLNQTIENQKVSVEPQGNFINIVLYLTSELESEDSLSLKIGLNNPQNGIYNQPFQSPLQQPISSLKKFPEQFLSLDTTNIPIYSQNSFPETQINFPQIEGNTTTSNQDIFINPIENITTTSTQEIFTNPIESNTLASTQEIYTNPIESNTLASTQEIYTNPIESNTLASTQEIFTNPIENIATTSTQDIFTNPIESTSNLATQDIFTTPIENNTTSTTQNIFTTTTNNEFQNYNNIQNYDNSNIGNYVNENIQNNENENNQNYENLNYQNNDNINIQNYDNTNVENYDNYQNYDNININGNNQVNTNIYNTRNSQKIEKITLSLSPSRNKWLNENQITSPNDIPLINSPKREQIRYSIPGSPSTAHFTYSSIPSYKNQDIYNPQKIVETTTTINTTKDYQQYNPNIDFNTIPNSSSLIVKENPDINIYKEKITQLQNETTKIYNDYEILKNEVNKLRGENDLFKNQIQILSDENKILREKNGAMPNENQIHEIEILTNENAQLKKQIEQKNNIQKNFELYKKLKEEEIRLLKFQIQELLKNKKKLEEFISQKQKEIEDLKLQISELLKNVKISESKNYTMNQQQRSSNRMGPMSHQTLTIQDTSLEVVKGDIIISTEELEFLTRKICKNFKKITLDLLYKATVDGDKAEEFHDKCDSANSTIVLVKSGNEKRFGGYTTCKWEGDSIEKKDENAFVFSLDKMQIYEIIPGEDAIGCYPKYGPVFLGCQIRIYDDFFTKGGTTFEKGVNYNTQEDFELSGGLKEFQVKEIEVYSVNLE